MVEFGPIGVNERKGKKRRSQGKNSSNNKEVGNPLLPAPMMGME